MRLYNAVCAWLEAHAAHMDCGDDQPAETRETQLDTLIETAHPYTSEPELHAGHREPPYDDEARARRRGRPIGFHPNR